MTSTFGGLNLGTEENIKESDEEDRVSFISKTEGPLTFRENNFAESSHGAP